MKMKAFLLIILFSLFNCSSDSLGLGDGIPDTDTGTDMPNSYTVIESNEDIDIQNDYPLMTKENYYTKTGDENTSTFSVDVDNASYSLMRRSIVQWDAIPDSASIRIEEMINYFNYNYAKPADNEVFSVYTETATAPWNSEHSLLHIGIRAKDIDTSTHINSNLVFLLDVSGSMTSYDKLPLLKTAMKTLLNGLSDNDRVAIVTYASGTNVVLSSTECSENETIIAAIDNLQAGGSTSGANGLLLAYNEAKKGFIPDGNNRVILGTDGDFNVGPSSNEELVSLIESHRDSMFLTILGFGMGNYMDSKMEELSNAGNGNYFYIDGEKEINRVVGKNLASNLYSVAKDVKIQVVFDSTIVSSYRLVGYNNRRLNNEDFENDKKDAGDVGPNHTVTAMYEITLKENQTLSSLGDIKIRYKNPEDTASILIENIISAPVAIASNTFNFSSAVVEFGMLLMNSIHKGSTTIDGTIALAKASRDISEEKSEFIEILEKYKTLSR